jgi:maltose alpha-D-glucosyltransferase/alpha-amylase
MQNPNLQKIEQLWYKLYPNQNNKLHELIDFLNSKKHSITYSPDDKLWYKKGLVYSCYVDLFAGNFQNMKNKLDYLQDLGVTILWLLPILESPMKDQGFDISDYYKVRDELGGNESFFEFVELAHQKGIKILFDVAINHTSIEHPWFQDAKKSKNSKYRDYYIWSPTDQKYSQARLLFKGMVNSNWTYNPETQDYYFHRFYEIQPDLNYKNPDVLIEMIKIFAFWKEHGVDGFRMDAAPFLWKEEGTNCENLIQTHWILKIFRASLDYLKEGTALIAEANQPPKDVVAYFGDSDECHVAYHFPVMPKIFLSIAEGEPNYIIDTLSEKVTPPIPKDCQWFVFLRCHDELTLEFVEPKEREKMLKYYLLDPRWNFREGEGIAGRLYNQMNKDYKKVLLAYSVLFSLHGTPINYFGDEIAMENNEEFYKKMTELTGYKDSRYFNRGPFDEEKMHKALTDPASDSYKVFHGIKEMLTIKRENEELFTTQPTYQNIDGIFKVTRQKENKTLTIYNNLTQDTKTIDNITLKPYQYKWQITKQ